MLAAIGERIAHGNTQAIKFVRQYLIEKRQCILEFQSNLPDKRYAETREHGCNSEFWSLQCMLLDATVDTRCGRVDFRRAVFGDWHAKARPEETPRH